MLRLHRSELGRDSKDFRVCSVLCSDNVGADVQLILSDLREDVCRNMTERNMTEKPTRKWGDRRRWIPLLV